MTQPHVWTWPDGSGSPAEEIDDIGTPIVPPKGCASTADHERRLTRLANFVERTARGFGSGATKASTMGKLFDVAIKARRAAMELATRREDAAIVDRREKRIQERARRTVKQ